LSDPQKKDIYDTYGEEGLAFYDNGVFGEDGEFIKLLAFLQSPMMMALGFCGGLLIWSIFTLFPIFIVLKV
jgi:DnaJ-class molecular chaperone